MASPEEIARKRKVRGAHRASVTRILTKVNGISIDNPEESLITQWRSTLKEKGGLLKKLDDELLGDIPDEELEEEILRTDIIQEDIGVAMLKLERILKDQPASVPEPEKVLKSVPGRGLEESGEEVKSTVVSECPAVCESRSRVKLPEINLKRFNGDITMWTTFWDSYESTIHNNGSLSNIEKFIYLNSLLGQSAAEAVAGLAVSDSNYPEAIDILKRRYGDKQLIINRHMEMLLKLDPVASSNLRSLRHLCDQVESHVRGLRSLGVQPESYGTLLTSILMEKLPADIKLIISRTVKEEWELESLLGAVEQEIKARERSNSKEIVMSRQKIRGGTSTSAALMSNSEGMSCVYCTGAHTPSFCRKVIVIAARKEILKSAGRCFICLRKGHLARKCRSGMKCNHCYGRHHSSICVQGNSSKNVEEEQSAPSFSRKAESSKLSDSGENTKTLHVNVKTSIMLQTARVTLFNTSCPERTMTVRLIFDSGSQRTYVTTKVKEILDLQPNHLERLNINTFGHLEERSQIYDVVTVGIETRGDNVNESLSALVVPVICGSLICQPVQLEESYFDHIRNLDLADFPCEEEQSTIDILIGLDNYWKLVTGEIKRGVTGPVAIATRVGWVLSGPAKETSMTNLLTMNTIYTLFSISEANSLDDQLKKFWDVESLGVTMKETSQEESFVHEFFKNSVSFKRNQYEVKLPWRREPIELTNNYELSKYRLYGLLNRLRQSPDLLKEYDAIIKEQLKQGIVELVKEDTQHIQKNGVYYIPHQAVIRRDRSTTKVRIVYDASAKSKNELSLNDCLYKGPKFDQNIMDIWLRFRCHSIAITADIEKAFLMVRVAESDQDFLRFLWIDCIENSMPQIVHLKFTRVVFGLTASPFLLNATVNHHLESYRVSDPEFVGKLKRSIYVDDVIFGARNVQDAFELYRKANLRLQEGGFRLRKFTSNSTELNSLMETEYNENQITRTVQDDTSYAKTVFENKGHSLGHSNRVLGLIWNSCEDMLIFDFQHIASLASKMHPTKRNAVCLSAKIYDPLGLVAPVTTRFKVFFQTLCKEGVLWDEPLIGETLTTWKKLTSELAEAEPISLNRCYDSSMLSNDLDGKAQFSLHGFCDASLKAYAAVIYLKIEKESESSVALVASKTRVAPLKTQTVPRLELLSALLLARLMTMVVAALESELKLMEGTLYTDSLVALAWIKNTSKEWSQFVENRVQEIRRLTPPRMWNHCPGVENPADLPSRGLSPAQLQNNSLWWKGPDWLVSDKNSVSTNFSNEIPECLMECKKKKTTSLLLNSKDDTGNESSCQLSKLIDVQHFSSLSRLLKVTYLVFKFVKSIMGKLYTVMEGLKEVERLWLIECQRTLTEESKFHIWQQQFGLFKDQFGLIRCQGRLENSEAPYDVKHPVILTMRHPLCELIVRDCHQRVKHNGVKETLTQLRSKFWLVKGRSIVRKIIYKCVVCRKLEGLPYKLPPPPPLPSFRVNRARPFEYSGVDFAGPLFVRPNEQKVWICLFTCCAIRAIHLELVADLTTGTFLNCLRRFVGRRGLPLRLISDNGKTFKAAAKVVHKILSSPEVQAYFTQQKVDWTFNLERAPWWGGFFERMVGSVKRCLRKILKNSILSQDELTTALVEVEAVINSRPLSVISASDFEEPLTPSHLHDRSSSFESPFIAPGRR